MAGKYEDLLKLAQATEERSGVPNMPAANPLQGLLQILSSVAQQTGNPNTERGQVMSGAGSSYLTGLNTRNKQQFFSEVSNISRAQADPAQKIQALVQLQAMHGTDYGLGLEDIVKQFTELRNQDVTMRGQDINAAGQEWKPKTMEEALRLKEAEAGMKPASQGQETTALYASRIKQANEQFDQMADYINSLSVVGTAANKAAPNFLKSGPWQSYEQSQRNFLNAVLRRESGAVISPSEFAEGRLQYFPQPGDKPKVIAQKRANRDLVMKNFIKAAGRAYEPYESASPAGLPATPKGAAFFSPSTKKFYDAQGNEL